MIESGFVYAQENPAYITGIKLGESGVEDGPNVRKNSLYTTGVPLPFKVFEKAYVNNRKEVEAWLFKLFGEDRFNAKREFVGFIPVERTDVAVLEAFHKSEELRDQIRIVFAMLRASCEQPSEDAVVMTPSSEKAPPSEKAPVTKKSRRALEKGICNKCSRLCQLSQTLCRLGKGCRDGLHNNCTKCGKNSHRYKLCVSCKKLK
jgi:hypothetical protein